MNPNAGFKMKQTLKTIFSAIIFIFMLPAILIILAIMFIAWPFSNEDTYVGLIKSQIQFAKQNPEVAILLPLPMALSLLTWVITVLSLIGIL